MDDIPDTVEWRCKICGYVDRAADKSDASMMLAMHQRLKHPAKAKKIGDKLRKKKK